MKRLNLPPKQFISHLVIVLGIGVVILVIVLLLAQNSKSNAANTKSSAENEKLSREIKSLSQDISDQTDINQRYLRCILLIEREKFANVELRVEAIDKCAIESKLPNGEPSGVQPTNQQRQDFDDQPAQKEQESPRSSQSPQTNGPVTQAHPTPQTTTQSTPQPSLLEQATRPVTDFVRSVL